MAATKDDKQALLQLTLATCKTISWIQSTVVVSQSRMYLTVGIEFKVILKCLCLCKQSRKAN